MTPARYAMMLNGMIIYSVLLRMHMIFLFLRKPTVSGVNTMLWVVHCRPWMG